MAGLMCDAVKKGRIIMFVTSSLGSNEKGHLTVGGVDAAELVKEYGTPLYVMDERTIRGHCRTFQKSIEDNYGGNGLTVYASKAFNCKEMCRIIKDEGLGIDVVSGGELYTALSVDFPPERIVFHGNNKTEEEIKTALEAGVGRIVVDNLFELRTIEQMAEKLGKNAGVMIRIKPGIDAHTHNFIRTGQIDSKFGFALETGEAFSAVKEVLEQKNVTLKGIHCHIGSQIFEIEPFKAAAEVMLGFMAKVKEELCYEIKELNLGGGFGIRYLIDDDAKLYKTFMEQVSITVKETCKRLGLNIPFIMIEPGRAIVGPAGTTLYTVGAVKTIPGIRNYVSVDGGMTDNPRYILYQSEYSIAVANKIDKPADYIATIAGRCCESGDLIQEDAKIQTPEAGDILAVFCTGAYNYSMASNYNRVPRPAVVMIKDGKPRLIIKRESYEDMVKNDI